jgi:hypothetical protein
MYEPYKMAHVWRVRASTGPWTGTASEKRAWMKAMRRRVRSLIFASMAEKLLWVET